ncbi:AAA-like domain-containing protein [Argonema galeatum]|uniref:AAA-like domain-containing protein n=1 Tax=Argonema galeatum TaxID=2942762 RepID=UPI0020134768|nr:AAA-like domain-containing protein [Argonema galeatum]
MRFWHEEARRENVWQSVRLVLVHSTEVYVSLSINQSPFNVGLTIKLPQFTSQQVQDLAVYPIL